MSSPLVTSYWLLADEDMPKDANEIPSQWKYARFDTTDTLYICSFFVLPRKDPVTQATRYKFGLQDGEAENDWLGRFKHRYEWLVAEARTQNPSIRIIAGMMMWTDDEHKPLHIGDLGALPTPEARTEFAHSVKDLLLAKSNETYVNSAGASVSARIDGFDIDIEDGNLRDYLPEALSKLRSAFDSVRPARKFYLSITPAGTAFLNESCAASLDYLNMQNYDGGKYTTPDMYCQAMPDLRSTQLLYGFSSERPGELNACTSVEDAVGRCRDQGLGGIMTWRLNSGNWVYQEMLQADLYAQVKQLVNSPELQSLVDAGWSTGGKDDRGKPVSPYTEEDWIASNEWRSVAHRETDSSVSEV